MPCGIVVSCGISTGFPVLFPTERKVAHALLTRPPLEHLGASSSMSPLDLHVLGTPPAFVLSQDQTLPFNPLSLELFPVLKLNSSESLSLLIALLLLCIVFKVRCARCSRVPDYNTTVTFFCQALFTLIFQFFVDFQYIRSIMVLMCVFVRVCNFIC